MEEFIMEKIKSIIATEQAPAAIGPYSQAVCVGGLVFLSGQLALDPATGALVPGGIEAQTEQAFKNIEAILAETGLTTANIIKTTVFLADINDFAAMNEVYATHFTSDFPARSAVQVAALPKGGLVEIECIASRGMLPTEGRVNTLLGGDAPKECGC
jgi:2-iminobutanoate/2-iminopropanoate deaminase